MEPVIKKSRWQHLKGEILTLWILTLYLGIFFIAISYLRFAILQHAGVSSGEFWLNALKAVVCAKFMMLSKAMYPIRPRQGKPLVWHILGRSLAYVIMVTILIAIEEALVAKFHGHHVLNGITGLEPGTLNLFFALLIMYWLMVIPYITYSAIAQVFGENILHKLVFGYGQ